MPSHYKSCGENCQGWEGETRIPDTQKALTENDQGLPFNVCYQARVFIFLAMLLFLRAAVFLCRIPLLTD